MKRLLVTGGAGFIGSNFVRYMLGKYPDYRITVLDALTYAGNLDNFHDIQNNPNFQFFKGNIEDPVIVDNLARNVDSVLNFAAESHVDRSIDNPGAFIETDVRGVYVLLEAAKKYNHERYLQISCYDEATRALTKNGLKHYSQIKPGEIVLSLNLETKLIEEKVVDEVIVQDYDGDMVRFKSSRIDLMVTPNHRMLFTTPSLPGVIRTETAAELSERSLAQAPLGEWQGRSEGTVCVAGIGAVDTTDLFYLSGLFIGDGFTAKQEQLRPNKTGLTRAEYIRSGRDASGRFMRTGKIGTAETTTITCHRIFFDIPVHDKGRKRLEETLKRLGISWSAHSGRAGEHVYFSSQSWSEYFAQFGKGAANKTIPSWMLSFDVIALKALFDGLMDSDGHYPLLGNVNPRFSTSSFYLMTSVLELGFKLGYLPRFTERDKSAFTILKTGRVIRPTMPAYMVFFRSENVGLNKNVAVRESYRGKIWCLRVRDNKNFIVERGGTLTFCGNTDEVYGSIDTGSFKEGDPLEPNSPYSASKAGGELLVRAYHVTYGVPTIVTRGSNTFGPFHYPEKLIPLMITNAIDDLPLPVYGDGKQVRDWMYVLDHCAGIDLALHAGTPGEIYNVGGGNERFNIDVVRAILAHLGKGEDLIRYVRDRPGHDRRYAIDCAKLGALGYAPETSFDARLEETVRWYVDNEAWWRKIKEKQDEYKKFAERWYADRQ